MGDFNIDYNRYNSSNAVKTYADNVTSLGCKQLISWPTRLSLTRQSILDHIYIDNTLIEKVVSTAVIEIDITDDFPTVLNLNLNIKRKQNVRPWVRKIKPEKIENFVDELETELRKFSPFGLSELIYCMTNVTNSNFPNSRLSRKQFEFAKKAWITRDILNSIKHLNKLYSKYKKSLSEYDFKCYKTYRNKLTRVKDAAKAMYFQNLLKKSKNTSMTWKAVNKIFRKNPSSPNSLPAQLNVKGKLISDPSNVCDELN